MTEGSFALGFFSVINSEFLGFACGFLLFAAMIFVIIVTACYLFERRTKK